MKNKAIHFFLTLLFFCLNQVPAFTQITTYSFEQIDSLQKTEQRKVAIFIHTDWCRYCQAMVHTTFKNEAVKKFLNEDFYFIDLNAEEKREINFGGHTFKFKPSGHKTGIHELAEQFATIDNKVAYPTLCFLNADKEIVFQIGQFLNARNLELILNGLR